MKKYLISFASLLSLIIILGFNFSKTSIPKAFDDKPLLAPLQYVDYNDSLWLEQRDNKCGEWGGNFKSVVIYRDRENRKLYANYFYKEMDCSRRGYEENPRKNTIEKNGCELSDDELEMIVQAVVELTEIKLNRRKIAFHSGFYNHVFMTHGNLELKDFPSLYWKSFNLFFERLKSKKCN
ncbi:MAG: hypothetical protein ACPGXL_04160 [Chitinophagales bacterium]